MLFWAAVVVLLVAHMFGLGQQGRPLWFGWVPDAMASMRSSSNAEGNV